MNKYFIEIDYSTGNSFGSSREKEILDDGFESLEVATENLSRIQTHYRWYLWKQNSKRRNNKDSEPPCPEFIVKHKDSWSTPGLKLLLDNGKEYQIGPFWCGYFEELYGAEIKQILPSFEIF